MRIYFNGVDWNGTEWKGFKMQQTSLTSYCEEKENGNINKMQALVYSALQQNPNSSDMEIVKYLGLTENQVRPRRNELVKKGLVCAVGTRKCSITGKEVLVWKT